MINVKLIRILILLCSPAILIFYIVNLLFFIDKTGILNCPSTKFGDLDALGAGGLPHFVKLDAIFIWRIPDYLVKQGYIAGSVLFLAASFVAFAVIFAVMCSREKLARQGYVIAISFLPLLLAFVPIETGCRLLNLHDNALHWFDAIDKSLPGKAPKIYRLDSYVHITQLAVSESSDGLWRAYEILGNYGEPSCATYVVVVSKALAVSITNDNVDIKWTEVNNIKNSSLRSIFGEILPNLRRHYCVSTYEAPVSVEGDAFRNISVIGCLC